jgi:hypothetical protein
VIRINISPITVASISIIFPFSISAISEKYFLIIWGRLKTSAGMPAIMTVNTIQPPYICKEPGRLRDKCEVYGKYDKKLFFNTANWLSFELVPLLLPNKK